MNSESSYTHTVYLIHFETPYKHASHYIGYTTNLEKRLKAHKFGYGSKLMKVIKKAGITWSCVRTWEGTRTLERKLKNRHNAKMLCPVCHPTKDDKVTF